MHRSKWYRYSITSLAVGKEVLKVAVQEAESVVAPACGVFGVGNTSLNVRIIRLRGHPETDPWPHTSRSTGFSCDLDHRPSRAFERQTPCYTAVRPTERNQRRATMNTKKDANTNVLTDEELDAASGGQGAWTAAKANAAVCVNGGTVTSGDKTICGNGGGGGGGGRLGPDLPL
jgi:hypothetical protein